MKARIGVGHDLSSWGYQMTSGGYHPQRALSCGRAVGRNMFSSREFLGNSNLTDTNIRLRNRVSLRLPPERRGWTMDQTCGTPQSLSGREKPRSDDSMALRH